MVTVLFKRHPVLLFKLLVRIQRVLLRYAAGMAEGMIRVLKIIGVIIVMIFYLPLAGFCILKR